MFDRITVIGLGLIGGSLCLAVKEKRLAKEIVGVSRRKSTIDYAIKNKIVDFATLDLKDGVKNSDLVIITVPVLKIVDIVKQIEPFLKKGAIVTDAGSTKKYIVKNIKITKQDVFSFIGSHPIAGSEKSGIKSADKDLFKGAYCILTDSKDKNALSAVKKFWTALEMKVVTMSSDAHDKLLSDVSHLPHAAAASLVNAAAGRGLDFAAGGFKDITRIASGDPELWRDIFLTNRKNLAGGIRALKKELLKMEKALKNNNGGDLFRLLSRAKSIRDSL